MISRDISIDVVDYVADKQDIPREIKENLCLNDIVCIHGDRYKVIERFFYTDGNNIPVCKITVELI